MVKKVSEELLLLSLKISNLKTKGYSFVFNKVIKLTANKDYKQLVVGDQNNKSFKFQGSDKLYVIRSKDDHSYRMAFEKHTGLLKHSEMVFTVFNNPEVVEYLIEHYNLSTNNNIPLEVFNITGKLK